MDAVTKEKLLIRFSNYLDELDDLPEIIDCPKSDRFNMMVELIALKNEIKLESRQVKAAMDVFRDSFELIKQAHNQLETNYSKQRIQDTKIKQEVEQNLILELLELRDRLQAGQEHLTNYNPNWWARRGKAKEYVAEIAIGQTMLLRRLDETLSRHGVTPIKAVGQNFDPSLMHAIHTVKNPKILDGIVVTEIRQGFLYYQQLLRPAEVAVNKI
ncbi:hypothetical protein TI03_01910 [Achromatium sp. WMS1]|nr:hypothetical protein TI03_01910 [Achromatium sp. WMS1]